RPRGRPRMDARPVDHQNLHVPSPSLRTYPELATEDTEDTEQRLLCGLCALCGQLGRLRFGRRRGLFLGPHFVLQLEVELEHLADQLAKDLLVAEPPRFGQVVAVRAVGVARDFE